MKKWRISIIIICSLIFVFLSVSYALRTSLYLRARIEPKLAELGASVDGHFEFSNVRAMGFTGIILQNVTFWPNRAGASPILFDTVTIYPALSGMFFGDLNASRVEISNLNATLNLNPQMPDRLWIESLYTSNLQIAIPALSSSASPHTPNARTLPALACKDCHLSVQHKSQNIQLNIPYEEIEFQSANFHDFRLQRQPFQFCHSTQTANAPICFNAAIGALSLNDTLRIDNLEISQLQTPVADVRQLLLNEIILQKNDDRLLMRVDSGQIDAHIHKSASLAALSGDYLLEFAQVEILLESPLQRLGIGLNLRTPNGAIARIYGGYDIANARQAWTFDMKNFDIARFAQSADFSKWFQIHSLPLTGNLSIIYEMNDARAWISTNTAISQGAVLSPMLAKSPLSNIRAQLSSKAWIDFKKKTFAIEDTHGKLGDIPFDFHIRREPNERGAMTFDAAISSKGKAENFIPSLPNGFAPEIEGYRLQGDYDARLALSFDSDNYDALLLDADFQLDNVKTTAFAPNSNLERLKSTDFAIPVKAATVPTTIGPKMPGWVGFYDIPRHTAYAFVASEDGKFFTHPGFDIRAIRASLIADLKAGKIVRGGSTISQQVVKNLFLNHDKTASRKFQEAFLTWQMEKTLPKLKIFEIYINMAHLAKNIYGIKNAAAFYFNKPVSKLTLRESLFLASILPNPVIFGQQFLNGKLSSSRINKMINVGNALRATNRIPEDTWNDEQTLIKIGKISDRRKAF